MLTAELTRKIDLLTIDPERKGGLNMQKNITTQNRIMQLTIKGMSFLVSYR